MPRFPLASRAALCVMLTAGAAASVVALSREQTTAVVTLDQGWDASTQHRFYYESQGTRFIPAAMLEALNSAFHVK